MSNELGKQSSYKAAIQSIFFIFWKVYYTALQDSIKVIAPFKRKLNNNEWSLWLSVPQFSFKKLVFVFIFNRGGI